MENALEKETLMSALNSIGYNQLPQPLSEVSGDKIWAVGLAKVRKSDCSSNYVVVCNNGDGSPTIMKDFGHNSIIQKILEVYPIYFLDSMTMPNLRKQSDIALFLSERGEDYETTMSLLDEVEINGKKKSARKLKENQAVIKSKIIKYASRDIYNRFS